MYAQALKLADEGQNAANWASQVLSLFTVKEDKVSLSDEAKRLVGDSQQNRNSLSVAKPYEPGSVASTLA